MSEFRCPNCGQSSAPLLADRWARLLEPDPLSFADARGNAACSACGHVLRTRPQFFGRLSAARFRALVVAFLSAVLGACAYAYFSAGPR